MKYFSMFSGIGGFEYGIQQATSSLNSKTNREGEENKEGEPKREGERLHSIQRTGINAQNRQSLWKPNNGSKRQPCTCVGYSEINKYAKAIYQYHYPEHKNYGNAKDIIPEQIADFDLLVGGFPCQAFSIAGKRGGFDDTRGTLFFDVARVLKTKRPDWFLLENVKGLCSHDAGKTMRTIYGVLTDLGYTVGWEVVNSCKFGVPQNRERIFFVGHLAEAGGRIGKILPIGRSDGSNTAEDDNVTNFQGNSISNCVRSSGFNSKTEKHNWDYVKIKKSGERKNRQDIAACLTGGGNSGGNHSDMDLLAVETRTDELRTFGNNLMGTLRATGNCGDKPILSGTQIRRLTPVECERLQGFPDNWTAKGMMDGKEVDISDTQRYKALGNAVTTNVIEAFMGKILQLLN